MKKQIYYLQEEPFDPFLVGNFIPSWEIELLKSYCLN